MDEKRKVSRAEAITNCVSAVIWNVNWILDLIYGNTDAQSFMWHIMFAVVWNVLAVVCVQAEISEHHR